MQKRNGTNYCIFCEEVSPASNKVLKTPEVEAILEPSTNSFPCDVTPSLNAVQTETPAESSTKRIKMADSSEDSLQRARSVILEKIEWASENLKNANSVEASIQLSHLIRDLTETFIILKGAINFN